MHALRYCLDEAFRTLRRKPGTTLLSMLTIAVAALVLGGFLTVTVNLDRVLARWSSTAEVSVYLRDDISPDQRVALNQLLTSEPVVASRTFVSKADALGRFARDFPDLAAGLDAGAENPLPASIEVRLQPRAVEGSAAEALAQQLRRAPGVADVRYDRTWLTRLAAIVSGLRWAGWLLGAVLIVAAVLTVSTVVRLTLYTRRDEIEVMQLMGAPMGLLRGPLVTEGILHGGGGGLLALALLWMIYATVRPQLAGLLSVVGQPELVTFLPSAAAAALVAGGMVLGGLGGWLAARQVR